MGALTDQAMRAALDAILAALRSSSEYEEIAINAGPVLDLTGRGDGYCRRIVPLDDGTIVVRQSDSTLRTLTVKESVAEDIEAIALVSNTVAVKIYW